jgi:hypothetical protein
MQRIVCWNSKADGIDEKFGGNIEENKEEVETSETEDNVDLGDTSLLLEVVHEFVLAELGTQVSKSALKGRKRAEGHDRMSEWHRCWLK